VAGAPRGRLALLVDGARMSIVQFARLLAKLFVDWRPYRGRSEFAFGVPIPNGRYYRLKLRAPGFRKTVLLRRGTSDISTFERVLVTNAYNLRRLARWNEILALYARIERPLILDLGANIGLMTLYFAKNWSKARIIAVEPDERNFQLLKANVEDISNVTPIMGAAASEDGAVQIANPHDEAWALRTERVKSMGHNSIKAYSIRTLMGLAPEAQPFIVKMNIEGFERELFSRGTDWINSFPIIIVGLHDYMLPGQGSSNNFLRRISAENRDFLPLDESIVSIANDGDNQFSTARDADPVKKSGQAC
jgi:FkbM family methyltransferase